LPTITSDRLIHLLEQFVQESNQSLDILLVGALALQVAASPQDTALFLFNKTVELFCRNLAA
jgi:hypothetical protein